MQHDEQANDGLMLFSTSHFPFGISCRNSILLCYARLLEKLRTLHPLVREEQLFSSLRSAEGGDNRSGGKNRDLEDKDFERPAPLVPEATNPKSVILTEKCKQQ